MMPISCPHFIHQADESDRIASWKRTRNAINMLCLAVDEGFNFIAIFL